MTIVWVMSFSDWWFAADSVDQDIFDISEVLNFLVSLLSWFWVIFAKLAGEFLTNRWVYWEIIWLDSLLRKYWVIVKNIANFWLLFYFIYAIFLAIIKKDEISKKFKGVLLRILVAWVGIQASWFVTAALIDVSTITLAAVWSFPAQIISNSQEIQDSIKTSLPDFVDQNFTVNGGVQYTVFPNDWNGSALLEWVPVPIEWNISKEEFIDMLLPSEDDVSWPLYYIWFGILKANNLNSKDLSSLKWAKKTILNTIIQGGTSVIYAIELWVLCVLALMRILYLWMFIVLSPLVVLLWCISKADKDVWEKIGGKKWLLSSLTTHINFKSFFINAFKPAIIVLWMWMALIFSTLMSKVVNENVDRSLDVNLWWVQIISSKDDGDGAWEKSYQTTIRTNTFEHTIRHVGKGLLDVIMSIITVIIVYFIIKISVKIWWSDDFVSKKIDKIQWGVWDLMTKLPVMPVEWYDKNGVERTRYVNAGKVFGLWGESSVLSEYMRNVQGEVDQVYNEQSAIVSWWFGDNVWYLSANEVTIIEDKMKGNDGMTPIQKLEDTRSYIQTIRAENWKWMTLNPQTAKNDWLWIKQFGKWLTDSKDTQIKGTKYNDIWKNMIDWWNTGNNKEQGLDGLFAHDETNYVRAYADFFGLRSITKWKDLKDRDISKWAPITAGADTSSWTSTAESDTSSETSTEADTSKWTSTESESK